MVPANDYQFAEPIKRGEKFMALSSVRVIPTIMVAKGWHKAATLLETWFSRARYVRANPVAGTPPPNNELNSAFNANSLGGLAWIRGTDAGRGAYNRIFNSMLWRSANNSEGNARRKLGRLLRSEGILNERARNARFGFRNYSAAEYERTRTAVNASTYSTGIGTVFSGIDEMTAALGSFTLKFALNGTLTYEPPINVFGANLGSGRYKVKPESIDIWLWDLFDFEGDQPLGHWRESPPEVGVFGFNGSVEVTNRSFRDWRNSAAANRMGGDFYIYTEPVRVRLEGGDAGEFDITPHI